MAVNKFDCEYVYEYSALRYHKIIEADNMYNALNKFYEFHNNDKSIIVTKIKLI